MRVAEATRAAVLLFLMKPRFLDFGGVGVGVMDGGRSRLGFHMLFTMRPFQPITDKISQ